MSTATNTQATETITIKGVEYVVVNRTPAGAAVQADSGVTELIGLRRPKGRRLFAAWMMPDGAIGDVFAAG